jgi:hypothetical protein
MALDALTPLDHALSAAAGVAIAAACGLRAFLPLLALSLGVRFDLVHVHPGVQWIGGDIATVTLVWATLLELAADKVPALDHLLDIAAVGVRPAAAALAAWCTFAGAHPAIAIAAAVILGAGAMGVQVAKAKVRLGSSMLTLGTANPFLSFLEDAVAAGLAALAVLAPVAALLGVLLVAWAVRRAFRRPAPAVQ